MIDDVRAALRRAAVLLICGFAAGPVLLDACLISCQDATGASSAGVPACHDTDAPTGVRLNSPAKPCGHDHHANAATMAAQEASRALRPERSCAALTVVAAVAARPQSLALPMSHAQPRSVHTNRTMLTPLRV